MLIYPNVKQNYSLKNYNTFGLDVKAKYFVTVSNNDDIKKILENDEYKKIKKCVLGSGSNILFTKDFDGLVLKVDIKNIDIVREDNEFVWMKVGAGVLWDDFVKYTLSKGLSGVENLSSIPGTVGAAPVQNIGAYGREQKDYFSSLEFVNIVTGEVENFFYDDCEFGYRKSIFKSNYKENIIITFVEYKLSKKSNIFIEHDGIKAELERRGIDTITPEKIYTLVKDIREAKLPDTSILGNAGSFFKNPEVCGDVFSGLKQKFPGIVAYKIDEKTFKLAAGWLIDQCGWKGKKWEMWESMKNRHSFW